MFSGASPFLFIKYNLTFPGMYLTLSCADYRGYHVINKVVKYPLVNYE